MNAFCLEVAGPYACFTRPEMKVERVSYDVITPSAARAIFEAILWKPAIRWKMIRVEVLAPIRWASVRRNEVGKTAPTKTKAIFVEDERQQRAGLFLRDIKYRLHAQLEFIPPGQRTNAQNGGPNHQDTTAGTGTQQEEDIPSDETPAKYNAMFSRRAKKGQCFNQPYLGCREFSCDFRLVDPAAEPATVPGELSETRDLGWMLYDRQH